MEAATRECASRLGTSGSEMRFGVPAAVRGILSRLTIWIESQLWQHGWYNCVRDSCRGLLVVTGQGAAHVCIVGCSVFEKDRFN